MGKRNSPANNYKRFKVVESNRSCNKSAQWKMVSMVPKKLGRPNLKSKKVRDSYMSMRIDCNKFKCQEKGPHYVVYGK